MVREWLFRLFCICWIPSEVVVLKDVEAIILLSGKPEGHEHHPSTQPNDDEPSFADDHQVPHSDELSPVKHLQSHHGLSPNDINRVRRQSNIQDKCIYCFK